MAILRVERLPGETTSNKYKLCPIVVVVVVVVVINSLFD
jgi:hypothetical protein